MVYQLDMFEQVKEETMRPSHNRETVSEAEARKELQVKGAGEQKRALAMNLYYERLNNLKKPPCTKVCPVV